MGEGCVCDDGWSGDTCEACAVDYGATGSCNTTCSASETCLGTGRCQDDGTCECFPTFNCSRLYAVFHSDLSNASIQEFGNFSICGDTDVSNECLEFCSAEEYQDCQDDFQICMQALGKSEGACECLGRLKKCSVDAGCDKMSREAITGICGVIGCSAAQCQLTYPKATHCDWDTHAECELELEQCLDEPNATIIRMYSYPVGVFGLERWMGDSYHVEQDKFTERCKCYNSVKEMVTQQPAPTCGTPMNITRFEPQDSIVRTVNGTNQTYIEWVAPLFMSGSDTSNACMSSCVTIPARTDREVLVAFDCAVCGDGNFMPGREECDDGNLDLLDGCSNECKIEPPDMPSSALFLSEPSPFPGFVVLLWNHTLTAVHAARQNLAHTVVHYDVVVRRRLCLDCQVVEFTILVPYDECRVDSSRANMSDCTLVIPNLEGGEFLNISLGAVNMGGMSSQSLHETRWLALPSGDIRLKEFEGSNSVHLQWEAPSNTGFGNSVDQPILNYFVEISSCQDFLQEDLVCSTWQYDVRPDNPAIQAREVGRFVYPIVYDLVYDLLHPGFFYFYRVTPINPLGAAIFVERVRAQLGTLPYEVPLVQFPVVYPIPIAISDAGIQIWQGDSVSSSGNSTLLQVVGFPLVRDLSDLILTYSIDTDSNPLNNISIVNSLTIQTSSLSEGTVFEFRPPSLSKSTLANCGRCIFNVNLRFVKWSAKTITISINYFTYPQALMMGVNPYNGPVGGGTYIKLRTQDFEGPRTRAGAGLPSIYGAYFDKLPIQIFFSAGGNSLPVSNFHSDNITVGLLESDMSRSYELEVLLPESPVDSPTVASIQIVVSAKALSFNTMQADLTFEYIGAKILACVPASGYLNPGSGGATVQLKVANLQSSAGTQVTFAGILCEIIGISDPVPNDLGTVSSVSVKVPELPYIYAGSINATLDDASLPETLSSIFQYVLPPKPVVIADSMIIAENEGLWSPASNKGYPGSFIVQNLSPKYGIFYDEVQITFGGKPAVVQNYLQLGLNSKVTFTTPDKMAPGMVPANVTVWKEGKQIETIDLFDDNMPFVIEFRDLSQPRVLGVAPTAGPARGGTVVMVAVLSFAELVAAETLEAYIGGSNQAMPLTVLGMVSVLDWVQKRTTYLSLVSLPEISTFNIGINDGTQAEIHALVSRTIVSIEQESFDPMIGMQQAGFAFLQMPYVTVEGSTMITEIGINPSSSNTTVKSSFTYTASASGVAVGTVSTEKGDLIVGLDGDVRFTVSLSNFDTVYKSRDIIATLGESALDISRLLYSTQAATKLYITAPPGAPGVMKVTLKPKHLPSNVFEFSFEYADMRVPEVTAFSPFLVYTTGGVEMQATVALLPDVTVDQILVDVLSIGETSTTKIASVVASKLVRQGGVPPEDTAFVTFTIPAGISGQAQFVIGAASKASICPETKPDCQKFRYAAVPTTAPNIKQFNPAVASSLGGTSMSISMTNFRMVTDISDLRVHFEIGTGCSQNSSMPYCFQAELQASLDKNMRLVTNILETRLSFTSPVVPDWLGGQNGNVKIWNIQTPSLFAIVPAFFRDDNIAEVAYVYPASIKANGNDVIEVLVSKLGYMKDAANIHVFVAYESSCDAWSESSGKGSTCVLTHGTTVDSSKNIDSVNYNHTITKVAMGNGGLVVSFAVTNRRQHVGRVKVTISNCLAAQLRTDLCKKKTATFYLEFRDPRAPFIEIVEPLEVATDGRVPVRLSLDNLPASVTKSQIMVGFPSNASCIDLIVRGPTEYAGLNRAIVTVLVPASATAKSVVPTFRIPAVGMSLTFPQSFLYRTPAEPVLLSFNPSSAPFIMASPVRITVQNFPGISSASDVVVQFKWPNANPVEASVTGYTQVDRTKFSTAIQDYLIDVDSPTGSLVKAGVVVLSVYHVGYRSRQSSKQGFRFIDTSLPRVDNMKTDASTNGADAVEVRMSDSTKVTVSIINARTAIVGIRVDGKAKDLVLSQYAESTRSANAVFNSNSRVTMDSVFGMMLFGSSCGIACNSDCCITSACPEVCSCETSCFKLVYFNDLAPRVSFVSGTIGTELGGSVMTVKITNFPIVEASPEPSTEISGLFDSKSQARVFVQSSSASEMSLQVETPEIDLQGKVARTVLLQLSPNSNPNQVLNINYLVGESVPQVSGKVLPTMGMDTGGVRTTIRIQFFPFPTDVIIQFGETVVEASKISVAASSTKLLSTIIFETPSTDAGDYSVRVTPKVCPNCGKSVTFAFRQIDPTRPVILAPAPTGGPFQSILGSSLAIKVAPFPTLGYEALIISCAGTGITVGEISIISVVLGDIATISFSRPAANMIGKAVCTLTVTTGGKKKTGNFNYEFYDGTAVRLMRVDPPQMSTRLSVYGRTLDLTQPVKLTIANFVQGLMPERLSMMLGASTVVSVTSVVDVVSCSRTSIDCNRTEVTVSSPAQDVARSVPFTLLIQGGGSIPLLLPYFKPCDYATFCNNKGMLMDVQRLRVDVPPDNFCNLKFCVDPLSPDFPKAAVTSVLPNEGPATGGTIVQVFFDNIPAFAPGDITIVIGSGASAVYAKVISVSNPGGNLLASKGVLRFETPSISNTAALTQLGIEFIVYVGTLAISVGKQFTFTPVPIGRALLASLRPESIFSEANNSVLVQLTNFPLITKEMIADTSLIKATFEGETIKASAITASTYDFTLARFVLRGVTAGQRPLEIYYEAHGLARAAQIAITVLPAVTPEVMSFFPTKGIAARDLSLSVTVRYMRPEIGADDFKASIVAGGTVGDLPVGSVVVLTPTGCMERLCAKVTVPLTIAAGLVADSGGSVTLRIECSKQKVEAVEFKFAFDPSTTPVLESIIPKTVSVAKLSATVLTLYVSNVASTFCDVGSTCMASFTFGTGTLATTRNGVVKGGSAVDGLRTIFVQPPFAPKAQGGIVNVKVQEGSVLVSADLEFATPDAGLVPIDGPCNGGVSITVSAMGWGKVVRLPTQITVSIGGKKAGVGAILSSTSTEDTSVTTFTVMTPLLSLDDMIPGIISFERYTNRFNFDCFDSAVAVVTPKQASLKGKTSSADGRSVTISMRNFPALKAAADVTVKFGNTKCGGDECNVLSFKNLAESVDIVVSVPAVERAMEVILMVEYVGTALPPQGGDLAAVYVRSRKFVTSTFQYNIPPPLALTVLFCEKCNSGPNSTSCLVAGLCGDGAKPADNMLGITPRAGVMTVVVDNIGDIPWTRSDGQVAETAAISVQFGDYAGLLQRILYTDETRSAFEVVLNSPAESGQVEAEISIQMDITRPTLLVARFNVKLYDESVKLTCDMSTGCNGQVEATRALVANVLNLVVGDAPVSDTYMFLFDGTPSESIQLVRKGSFGAIFRVIPPAYTCASCKTREGKKEVDFVVAYKSTRATIAETKFTYWSSPGISSLRFDSTGGKMLMSFDQSTDKAQMTGSNTDCSTLFDEQCVALFGTPSKCLWQSSRILEISLASDAAVDLGSPLYISKSAGLRSSNSISTASAASAKCAVPLFKIPPRLEVKSPETIDPCASLELRATAVSPRPPTYIWTCTNDDNMASFLSTQSGDTIYLPPGTADMTTLDKIYKISVYVKDFLGSVSETKRANILKKSTATPQIQFNPPTETTTINKEVMIKGEAVFSTCLIKQEDLAFEWRQVSGPSLPASLLTTELPQLQIPSGTLKEGAIYEIALKLRMSGDSSKGSESIFVLMTEFQGLQAAIQGGESMAVSSASEIKLSASPSRDLDLAATAYQGLNYSWSCSYYLSGVENVCRNVTGEPLTFARHRDIRVKPGLLPPAQFPYVFILTISKRGLPPSTYSKKVFVRYGEVPLFTIEGDGGTMRPDGSLYVTSTSRLIISSHGDKPSCRAPSVTYPASYIHNASNTTKSASYSNVSVAILPVVKPIYDPGITEDCISAYNWTFEPPLETKSLDVPFGYHREVFVLNSAPDILFAGNTYLLKLSGGLVQGGNGESSLTVVVNTPPVSGTFRACLSSPGISGCIKTGVPITDDFRITCSGWVDIDLPLMYEYGYKTSKTTGTGNESGTEIEEVWYDGVADNTRDIGFPVGSVQLLGYVVDAYGARTDLQTDEIMVSDQGPGGRRLLASGGFWEAAKAKLKASLQTFRADKINQMAGAMSGSSDGMSLADQQGMKGNLLETMASGASRSTATVGGQCESFSASKAVTSNAGSLGGQAVGGVAAMMKAMLKKKLAAAIPLSCAANAAGSMGGGLKAQALYKKANPGKTISMNGPEFMASLESGMKQVMSQAVLDAVTGEGPRQVSLETAEHNVNRVSANQLGTGATYEKWSHPVPAMFPTTRVAAIQLPDSFTTDLFGSDAPDVDIHTQSHGFAPDAVGFKLMSPMVGLTVSYAKSSTPIPVANLSKPILITIPVDTSDLNFAQRLIFAQQVKCVFWDNTTYSDYGCNVSESSIFSVTCKCTHLTLFAIHHDTSARACGDGVIQQGEQCDDLNAIQRDGCSSSCQIEDECECSGEPSSCKCKKSVTDNTPAIAGIKASLILTGYSSMQDFLNGQAEFQGAIASALGIPGMTAADVVVLKVCWGSDCRLFWEGRRSMHLLAAASALEVDFFVNKGDPATTIELYNAVTSPTFLSSFISLLSAITGRTITAKFGLTPQVVEDGSGFNKPGFGPKGDLSGNGSAASIFGAADDALPGISGWLLYLLVGLSCLAITVFLCAVVIIPAYKTHVKARKKTQAEGNFKQHKIHPLVLDEIKKRDNVWKSEKPVEEEDTGHIFDALDSEDERSDADSEIETEILPFTLGNSRDLGPYEISTLQDDGLPPAVLWPGATSLVSTDAQQATGRWGHARSRLKALEMQLDELLDKLPKGDHEDEDTLSSSASELMAEAGAPRERPQYARPSLPDLSPAAPVGVTPENQPIRRVRRRGAVPPGGTPTRPPVSTVRRAPKLTPMIDEMGIFSPQQGPDAGQSSQPKKQLAWE